MKTKPAAGNPSHRRIFTVSELTAKIKNILEEEFSFVWISAEISNFSKPASGHYYFTLKDENAQIRAVMFRGQNRNLAFKPTDGMQIVGLGRISLYEPRGTYQLILEYLEPKGVGALQVAFEQLKNRLEEEGLFEAAYKKHLPFLPQKIALITSATGAVVHDMLRIINRRFNNIRIFILPVMVQGENAANEIVAALKLLNRHEIADVVIVARGGGSLEDMAAFNSEAVARAIYAAEIPVISAVGHETDFSIADFVADLRAPTPSAAAELVVPLKQELVNTIQNQLGRLKNAARRHIQQRCKLLVEINKHLINPRRKIQNLRLRLDEVDIRLRRVLRNYLQIRREHLKWWHSRLYANRPDALTEKSRIKLDQIHTNLLKANDIKLALKRLSLRNATARLNGLNPSAVLARGYSITRNVENGEIIRDPLQVVLDQRLEVMLHKGSLSVDVRGKYPNARPSKTSSQSLEKDI